MSDAQTLVNTTPTASPRRRWFQFTLRRLLVVITLVGILCGWSTQVIEQIRAVRSLGESGATFRFYRTSPDCNCYDAGSISFGIQTLRDGFDTPIAYRGRISSRQDLQALASLKSLESVQAEIDMVDDHESVLSVLRGLKKLRVLHLDLHFIRFEPRKLDFKEFANLEMLVISQVEITPELIDRVGEIPKLHLLQLDGVYSQNAAAALKRLPSRIDLAVTANSPTDSRTIRAITELESLNELNLFQIELNGDEFPGLQRNDRITKLELNSVRLNKTRFDRFPNLEEVDVYDSELDDIAVRDLLNSPHLTRLRLGCNVLPEHVAREIDWNKYSSIELNLNCDLTEETLRLILSSCDPVHIDLTNTDLTYSAYRRLRREFPQGSFRTSDKWQRLNAQESASQAAGSP